MNFHKLFLSMWNLVFSEPSLPRRIQTVDRVRIFFRTIRVVSDSKKLLLQNFFGHESENSIQSADTLRNHNYKKPSVDTRNNLWRFLAKVNFSKRFLKNHVLM